MSHGTPFPGISAPSTNNADLARHIEAFQAAMYRVNDCLRRIGDKPLDANGTLRGLDYIDRQLMLCSANLEASRLAVSSIMGIVDSCLDDTDDHEALPVELAIATPDGSGRNAGGEP